MILLALAVNDLNRSIVGTVTLRCVSPNIRSAEVDTRVGRSGSGKSTIVKFICWYPRSDSGSAALNRGEIYCPTSKSIKVLGVNFKHPDIGLVRTLFTQYIQRKPSPESYLLNVLGQDPQISQYRRNAPDANFHADKCEGIASFQEEGAIWNIKQ